MAVEILEGLRFIWSQRLLRPLVICMGFANMFDLFGMVQAILVIYAINELNLSALQLGTVMAVAQAGALLGALVNGAFVRQWGVGATIAGSAAVPGIAVLLLPLAQPGTHGVVVLAAGLALAWFAVSLFNINQLSLRQAVTPLELQGRMNASVRFLIWGTIPIGAFLGGVLGGAIGLRPTLVLAGTGSVLASLAVILSPIRTLREIPGAEPTASAQG